MHHNDYPQSILAQTYAAQNNHYDMPVHYTMRMRKVTIALVTAIAISLFWQSSTTQAAPVAQEDTTPPVANPTYSPDPGPDGWSNVDVTITFNWSDEGSGIDPNACPAQEVSTGGGSWGILCLDLAGNAGVSGNAGARVDKQAPNTQITQYPETTIDTDTATFIFKVAAPSDPPLLPVGEPETFFIESNASPFAGHECQVDGGGWIACTSPQTLTGLTNGTHTFEVRGWDVADNVDPTPSVYTWMVAADILIDNCGGYDVFQTPAGTYTAPGFAGNLIVGTDSSEQLNGTADADLILGMNGADTINGAAGNDLICGGYGHDIIDGGQGNDIIYGDAQDDQLSGGYNDDILYGGRGQDDLFGNTGQDELYGQGDHDFLRGGADNDILHGGTGPDRLEGHGGDDALIGGPGDDNCQGGPGGNDTVTECEGASAASVNVTHRLDNALFLPMVTSGQ